MDVHGVSRRFGAVALVAGPLALVMGSLWQVYGDDDSVPVSLAKVARHQSDQRVVIVADLLAGFLLPAVLYLMRLSGRGAPRLALIGGSVAFLAWLAGIVSLGGSDVLLYHAAQAADRTSAVSLVKSVVSDPAFAGPEAVFIVGHLLGMLLLGIALWRSRAVPLWAAALVGIAPILHLIVHDLSGAVNAGAYALFTIGMAACAVALWRRPDEQAGIPAVAATARNIRSSELSAQSTQS